jgi:hypothetical protein
MTGPVCGRFQRNIDGFTGVFFSLLVQKTTPEFQNGSVQPVLHGLVARKLVKTRQ